MLSPTLTTFLFEVANFLVLAGVLGWLFFKPVRQALAEYRAQLDAQAKAADEKLKEVDQSRAQIAEEKEAIRQELARLREEATAAARKEADTILAQAKERAERVKQSADQHVLHLQQAETSTLSHVVATTAAQLVQKLLVQIQGPQLQACLLQAACEQLQTLKLDAGAVQVATAEPLSDTDRRLLESALGQAAAQAEYSVLPEIGAGVRVTTARGLIDATVGGLATFAEQELIRQLEQRAAQGGPNGSQRTMA